MKQPQTLVKGSIITRERQEKSDRLSLISMCGVLTPVRSSSPVSFSRNFLLAFKVKCQARSSGCCRCWQLWSSEELQLLLSLLKLDRT